MKKKGKLLALAALCLAFGLGGTATAVTTSFFDDVMSATAEENVTDMTKLISSADATVTAGKTTTLQTRSFTGLTVENEGNYSASINGIFTGNTRIDFSFLGTEGGFDGDFTFRITDAKDDTKYFDIYQYKANWSTTTYVIYSGQWRNTCYWDATEISTEQNWGDDKWMGGPNFGVDESAANYRSNSGYISLEWEEDVLEVHQYLAHDGSDKLITKFDGTDKVQSGENCTYGLPKLSFSDGYKISFSSGKDFGTDICFTKIAGVDVTGMTLEEEPEFYTAWKKADENTIRLESSLNDTYILSEPPEIPAATYTTAQDKTPRPVERIEMQKDSGEWKEVKAGDVISEAGEYIVRYTAVVGSQSVGNTLEKSFSVCTEYYELTDMISATGAKVVAGVDESGKFEHKGLLIRPDSIKGAYSGTFNGVFTGDAKLEFNFPGELHSDGNHNAKAIDFKFRFTSVANPEDYFEVVYFRDGWNGWYNAAAVVDSKGNIRTTRVSDLQIFTEYTSGNEDSALNHLPMYGGNDSPAGYLDLVWEGDVLAVYVLGCKESAKRVPLAKFDSDTYTEPNNDTKTYGLEKLDFSEGYIVSFEAKSAEEENTAPLLLEKINGISLTDKWFAPKNMHFEKVECLGGKNFVEVSATIDEKDAEEVGLGAKFYYTVSLGTLTLQGTETVYPDDFDLTDIGSHEFTYTYLGQSITQTLKVFDAPPTVILNNVASETIYRKGGPNESTMELLTSDVRAVDLLEGEIGSDKIEIYIKVPEGTEFVKVAAGAFRPETTGVYTVKYVAKDSNGNAGEITRTIEVIDGTLPVITIDGEIPETALIGSSFTVPAATAKDGNETLNVSCTVYFGENIVELQDGKLVFEQEGIYKISYYAVDKDGIESLTEYFISVAEDSEKPVISEVELPSTALVGTEIALPEASATDNVDGTVSVNVVVKYGTEEVKVTDGKFVVEKQGVYTVIYTATDKAGHTAELKKEITVQISSGTSGENTSDVETEGCGSSLSASLVGFVGIAGAAMIIKKKKRS